MNEVRCGSCHRLLARGREGIIEEMKKDGTLSSLTTKWYGKDYSAN